jgi:hypothetical protein
MKPWVKPQSHQKKKKKSNTIEELRVDGDSSCGIGTTQCLEDAAIYTGDTVL